MLDLKSFKSKVILSSDLFSTVIIFLSVSFDSVVKHGGLIQLSGL